MFLLETSNEAVKTSPNACQVSNNYHNYLSYVDEISKSGVFRGLDAGGQQVRGAELGILQG